MSSLNRITLIGEIASDPELKETTNGDPVLRFKVKSDRPAMEGVAPKTDILDVVVWRDTAQRNQDLQQGGIVLVDGRIITRTYDDESGQRHWVTEVEGRDIVRFAGGATPNFSGASATSDTGASAPAPAAAAPAANTLETKPFDAVKESNFDFGDQKVELKESTELPPQFETPVEEDIPF